jgi:hypothetical protein
MLTNHIVHPGPKRFCIIDDLLVTLHRNGQDNPLIRACHNGFGFGTLALRHVGPAPGRVSANYASFLRGQNHKIRQNQKYSYFKQNGIPYQGIHFMQDSLRNFKAEFFKALSHPIRIKIFELLRAGELSVTDLQDRLGIESSSVSQHLSVLLHKNIVESRKAGTTVY